MLTVENKEYNNFIMFLFSNSWQVLTIQNKEHKKVSNVGNNEQKNFILLLFFNRWQAWTIENAKHKNLILLQYLNSSQVSIYIQ